MPIFNDVHGDIFYEVTGEGPLLVLLNGIMMSTKSWEMFVKPINTHLSLLRLDFYDQGQSSNHLKPYDLSLQVDLLERLLNHLNAEKVHIVGISYGASVALQYAVKYPKKVSSLMVFNGVAKTSLWLKDIGLGWNEVAKLKNGLAYYHVTIPTIYSSDFYQKNHEWMQSRKKILVELFNDESFLNRMIRLTNSAETHDVEDALINLEMPVCVVASENDTLTPPFEQKNIASRLKNPTFILFPNAGHASMYEVPELFVSTILGFVLKTKVTIQI